MIIFRCEIARAMLRDVFATWDDWHAELGTVTGYDWDEYKALYARLSKVSDPMLSNDDEAMLTQAAGQFFGYPAIRTANLEADLGSEWEQHLKSAFRQGYDT
jgi:uncharacterized protein YbjT (DUF2867 family)